MIGKSSIRAQRTNEFRKDTFKIMEKQVELEVVLQNLHEASDSLNKLTTCEGHDTCRFSTAVAFKCPRCRATENLLNAILAVGKLKEWEGV